MKSLRVYAWDILGRNKPLKRLTKLPGLPNFKLNQSTLEYRFMRNIAAIIATYYREIKNSNVAKTAITIIISTLTLSSLPFVIALGIIAISVCVLFNVHSKYLSIASLFFLSSIPILLYFGYTGIAEDFAVYVYFLLVIVITLELKSYLVENLISIKKHENEQIILYESQIPLLTTEKKHIIHSLPYTRSESHNFLRYINVVKYYIFQSKYNSIWWNSCIVGVFGLLSFFIFNFQGLPYFRDIQTLPYYYNINHNGIDLAYFERSVFNQLRDVGIPAITLSNLFYQLTFFTGLVLTYYYILKIQHLFHSQSKKLYSVSNKIYVLGLTFGYIFSTFIFERMLMGQYNVIRGHFLLLPALYYTINYTRIFPLEKNADINNILSICLRFSWVITLVALVSVHHIFFVIGILTCLGLYSGIKSIAAQKKRLFIDFTKKSIVAISLSFFLLLPGFIILFNRYVVKDTNQTTSYNTTIRHSEGVKNEIIRSFSPKADVHENFLQRILIGSASWMTPSFIETEDIKEELGIFEYISLYYNPVVAWITILAVIIISFNLLFHVDKEPNVIICVIAGLIPISIVLNFGYSEGMEAVNKFFYELPFSYAMRESGKFYSLTIALLSILFAVCHKYEKKYMYYATIICVWFFVVSSTLPFLPLKKFLLYNNVPKSITTTATEGCTDGDKLIFFPFDTYITTSYVDTFTIYPYTHSTACDVIIPEKATIKATSGNENITLYSTSESQNITRIVEEYTESTNSERDYKLFKDQFTARGIRTIIIDPTHHQNLEVFNTYISRYLDSRSKDDNVFIYKLP